MSSDLIIYPQDFLLFLKITLVPVVFEVFRIIFGNFCHVRFQLVLDDYVVGYLFVGQSSQLTKYEKEKVKTQLELAQIKSIQLELVRHSKLERNLIKIDKEIEKLKASQVPKEKKMKSYFQIGRVSPFLVILCEKN